MARFSSALDIVQVSAPASPVAGRSYLFFQSDGLIYTKNSAGVVAALYSVSNKVPVAGLSATGTPSATTYLRGDNTWATPAGGGGASPVPYVLSYTGNLTAKVGQHRIYMEVACVVQTIRASVGTAPQGAPVVLEVKKNGTTIYTTTANRPTIAAATNTALAAAPDVTAFAAGDYLTIDIMSAGTTTAGADLTLMVRML